MNISYKNVIPLMLLLAFQSCSGPDKKGSEKTGTATVDSVNDTAAVAQAGTAPDLTSDEKVFALRASTGGMMEVEAATIALQKTKNEIVKDFASRMLKDHGVANKELEAIAKAKRINLATTLPEEHVKELDDLKTLSDRPFDVQYVKMMIEDHGKTVLLFSNGARLANPELKAFAKKTLPVIQEHHEMAIEIGKTLNIKNINNGDDVLGISPTKDHTH